MNIYKITDAEPVDFAAGELKKYLRMMMPDGGDVRIAYDRTKTDGFRLGAARFRDRDSGGGRAWRRL